MVGDTHIGSWQVWQSRDGDRPGQWYATRTGDLPDNPPDGWAMTVHGQTEGELRNAIARQVAMDRLLLRRTP